MILVIFIIIFLLLLAYYHYFAFHFLLSRKETKNKIKSRRMAAVGHNSTACKFYIQKKSSLMREIFRTASQLKNRVNCFCIFFMCCTKPVMQKLTFLFIVQYYLHISVKAV